MRTRCRFSTNRINYIRQRHHNKVYDFVNPILLPGFHSFPPYLEFLSSSLVLIFFFIFVLYVNFFSFSVAHTHSLALPLSRSLSPLYCLTLFLFLYYSVLGLSAYLRMDYRQIAAEKWYHLLTNIVCHNWTRQNIVERKRGTKIHVYLIKPI